MIIATQQSLDLISESACSTVESAVQLPEHFLVVFCPGCEAHIIHRGWHHSGQVKGKTAVPLLASSASGLGALLGSGIVAVVGFVEDQVARHVDIEVDLVEVSTALIAPVAIDMNSLSMAVQHREWLNKGLLGDDSEIVEIVCLRNLEMLSVVWHGYQVQLVVHVQGVQECGLKHLCNLFIITAVYPDCYQN